MRVEIVTKDGTLLATITDEPNIPMVNDLFVLPDMTMYRVVQRAFIGTLENGEMLRGPVDLSKPRRFTLHLQILVEPTKRGSDDAE